jgi:hypothetical protein
LIMSAARDTREASAMSCLAFGLRSVS